MSSDDEKTGARVAESVIDSAQVDSLLTYLSSCPQPVAAKESLTASYWVSTETMLTPTNPVEALISRLFSTLDLTATVGNVAGAEWWWQDTDYMDPPKAYHKDSNIWFTGGPFTMTCGPRLTCPVQVPV